MKKLLFILFILSLFIISGCRETSTESQMINNVNETQLPTEQETQPEITPSEIATDWVKALIRGSGSEDVFNYLPQEIKSKYSSYDAWNDELYNIKYAWNIQGLYFTFIEVKNELIQGDNASVDVKYKAWGIIQSTVTQKYEFIKEDNEWKLKEYYELTI